MALRLIGAGLGRTGTLSLKAALERLGFSPCYHGVEILTSPERVRHWLEPSAGGAHDWEATFDGFQATVDWPAAHYWRELVAHYPDAKVLLSRRDADRWYDSMTSTLYPALSRELPEGVPEPVRDFHQFLFDMVVRQTLGGSAGDREFAKRAFHSHNQAVIDEVPASRLLVYEPGDGWDPLCRFLELPVPDEEFPHLNDTGWYRDRARLTT